MAARQRSSNSIGEDMDAFKCTICTNLMEDNVCITPCGHRFCRGCIDQWLNRSTNGCPTCRSRVRKEQLIPDRELPEMIKKMKEMRRIINGIGQASGPANGQNTSTDGSTETPLWSQNVEHTKKLLEMKDAMIERLNARFDSHNTEVQALNDQVRRLKEQIHSLPTLKERIKQLEAQVTLEKREITELKGKVEAARTKESTYQSTITLLQKQKTDLEKKEVLYISANKKLSDDIKQLKEENPKLKQDITKTEGEVQYERNQVDKLTEENEELTNQLTTALQTIQTLEIELGQWKLQAFFYGNRVQQLESFANSCTEKDQVLHYLNGRELPIRNQHIINLQSQVARLIEELATIRRDTIPVSEHTMKIQAEVQQTKDNLQKSYEMARDTAKAFDEENRKTWQNRLTVIGTQLKTQDEMNALSAATPSYKKLVKENFKLQDTIKQLKENLHKAECRTIHTGSDPAEWLQREN